MTSLLSRHPTTLSRAMCAAAILLAACVACLRPAHAETPTNSAAPAAAAPVSTGTNLLWFPVGETLTYSVYWGFIPVGDAVVTSEWIEDDGRRLIQVTHRIKSNKVLATLYPVNDTVQTVIDPETFRSVSFFMDQKEGRHAAREVTKFDYAKGVARWESMTKAKKKEFAIDQDTRDLVTFMYFMRRDGFKAGEDRNFRVMADEKVYDLNVKVAAEEKVNVEGYGKVSCLRLEPTAQFNGLFVRKGKMTVWVSNDKRFLCTRVKAGVPIVGSVHVYLTSVGGPGNDFWTRKPAVSPEPESQPTRVRP